MDLLKIMSEVAEKQFTDLEQASNFFIRKEFKETIGSLDNDYAVAMFELSGYEPKYNEANNAYKFLQGIPNNFANSTFNLSDKIVKTRLFFLAQIKVPKKSDAEYEDKTLRAYKIIRTNGDRIKQVQSYIRNIVLTEEGYKTFNKYDDESRYVIRINEDLTLELNKVEIIYLVTRCIGQTKRLNEGVFNERQLRLLRQHLNRFSSEEVESQIVFEDITPERVDEIRKAYNKGESNPVELRLVYANLRKGIEDNSMARIYNICLILRHHKKYIIKSSMTVKQREM